MNISLAGDLGSGKTSVNNILRKKGYSYVSVGSIFRDIAEKKGVSVSDVNKLAFTDPSIDKEVDEMQVKLGERRTKAVFDSRLGFYFVPNSLKVYLRCDITEAAKRVMKDKRKGEGYASVGSAVAGFLERRGLERERYHKKYGVDIADYSNYDLVIDTIFTSPENVVKIILLYAEKGYTGKGFFMSPRSLYPTQNTRDLSEDLLNRYISGINKSDLFISTPICVTQQGDFYFIIDGHPRVVASLAKGVDFMVCNYVVANNFSCRREWCYDFEEFGRFRYARYPV